MQLDHQHQLYQWRPTLTKEFLVHDRSSNFCSNIHHAKEHLCSLDNFRHNFFDTLGHNSDPWDTNYNFNSINYQEWYCNWGCFTGSFNDQDTRSFFHERFVWDVTNLVYTDIFICKDFLCTRCNSHWTWEQHQRTCRTFEHYQGLYSFVYKVTHFTSQCVDWKQGFAFRHHWWDTVS